MDEATLQSVPEFGQNHLNLRGPSQAPACGAGRYSSHTMPVGPIIEFRHVTKRFGRNEVLHDVTDRFCQNSGLCGRPIQARSRSSVTRRSGSRSIPASGS